MELYNKDASSITIICFYQSAFTLNLTNFYFISFGDVSQCWLKTPGLYIIKIIFLRYAHVYRHESGRCCTLLPFLTFFPSFHLSRFPIYINIPSLSSSFLSHFQRYGSTIKKKSPAISILLLHVFLYFFPIFLSPLVFLYYYLYRSLHLFCYIQLLQVGKVNQNNDLLTSKSVCSFPSLTSNWKPRSCCTSWPYKCGGMKTSRTDGFTLEICRLYRPSSSRWCNVRELWISPSTSRTYLYD